MLRRLYDTASGCALLTVEGQINKDVPSLSNENLHRLTHLLDVESLSS